MSTLLERFLEAVAIEGLGKDYVRNEDPNNPHDTNCCVFAEAVVHRMYPGGAWSRSTHADLMVMDAERPFSPVDALLVAGVGVPVDTWVPGRIHYCQKWQSLNPLRGGHTFFVYLPPLVSADEPLIIEATNPRNNARRAPLATEVGEGVHVRMAILKDIL